MKQEYYINTKNIIFRDLARLIFWFLGIIHILYFPIAVMYYNQSEYKKDIVNCFKTKWIR